MRARERALGSLELEVRDFKLSKNKRMQNKFSKFASEDEEGS